MIATLKNSLRAFWERTKDKELVCESCGVHERRFIILNKMYQELQDSYQKLCKINPLTNLYEPVYDMPAQTKPKKKKKSKIKKA